MKQPAANLSSTFVKLPLSSDRVQAVVTFEERMSRDLRWALTEASIFFEGRGCVQESLRRISSRLQALDIDYAVTDGMAMFVHGFRRYTEEIEVLVTREGLLALHHELVGTGYYQPFEGSKHLRDSANGVKIKFVVAGEFPGDRTPKPLTFPNPVDASIEKGWSALYPLANADRIEACCKWRE